MVQFVSKIPIGPDDFQLGVVTYSFVPEVLFDLDDYSTNSEIIQVLKTITGKNGPTLTSSVIHKAHEVRSILTDTKNCFHFILFVEQNKSR